MNKCYGYYFIVVYSFDVTFVGFDDISNERQLPRIIPLDEQISMYH